MSGLFLGACLPNVKFVSLAIFVLLAFNAQKGTVLGACVPDILELFYHLTPKKFTASVTLAKPFLKKKFPAAMAKDAFKRHLKTHHFKTCILTLTILSSVSSF